MRPKLILVAGKADKREVRLKLPTIVGRTRDAGLMIAHKTVSRRHCELFERHGMLFVRDTGSRNGTLVDDAPVKESMVKPGHTITVGPLTFRAEYEPADSFIRSDDVDPAVAATVGPGPDAVAESSVRHAQTAKISDTPGELEFEAVEGDELSELSLPAEEAVAPLAEPVGEVAAEDEFKLDDDLAVEFDLDATGDAPVAAAAGEEAAEVSLEFKEDAPAGSVAELLAELSGSEDEVAFDLDAGPSSGGEALPEISLEDNDDMGFDVSAFEEPAEAAPAPAAASPGNDDLGFTLEDLEDSPAMEPLAESSAEEEVEAFEIADEPAPAPQPAKAAAGKSAKDASKVALGEEKAPGADSEMSRFMKELGL